MRLLLSYLKQYWKLVALALFLAAINQIFSLLDPFIFRHVIDEYATRYQDYTTAQFFRGVSLLLAAAIGVAFVSLAEGIDATTPAGKLQMHILGAIAEFERERIRERVLAGLRRARAHGQRLGRPRVRVPVERLQTVASLSADDAARTLGISRSTLKRWRRQNRESSSCET